MLLATQERLTEEVGKVTHLSEKPIRQTLIPTVVDLDIMYPSARPAFIPRTDDGRPDGRLLWTPGGQNGTSTSVFFFSAVPRIFLLPHTEANRGAVDRRVSQQATVAQSTSGEASLDLG